MKRCLSLLLISIVIITVACKEQQVLIEKIPFSIQCWTFRMFSFTETLQKVEELGISYLQAYPGQKLGTEYPGLVFDHNLAEEVEDKLLLKLHEHGITLVSYGVVDLGKDETSMRKVFDFAQKMGIKTIVAEPEFEQFTLIEKLVMEYDIQVAVHNHPQPSRYALPGTVFEQVKDLDPRIGACVDIGHWMRCGVKPIDGLKMLEGRILDVHIKDLNAFDDEEASDVPLGRGKANIREIIDELKRQNYSGYLAIEYEKEEDALNPFMPVRRGIDFVNSQIYGEDPQEILQWSSGGYSKHGWNHYGPGYFELDRRSGVIKSQGGMGLFWYSRKEYKDFLLELDFKCSDFATNSGIFLRVPEVVVSDDYIYHSFEIQIDDKSEGIHRTGAVYDAEPPSEFAANPTGEWNHYEITFIGGNIDVVLNGIKVIDWAAEPRGKIKDFALEGYIGLQNHDSNSSVYFRDIFVKEL